MRPLLLLPLAMSACTQPTLVPVDVAEAQCVQQVLSGAAGNTAVTVGIGTGNGWGYDGWGWGGGWGGGTGIAMTTTLPDTRNPETVYKSCVMRRSGQAPDTPLSERPEVKG